MRQDLLQSKYFFSSLCKFNVHLFQDFDFFAKNWEKNKRKSFFGEKFFGLQKCIRLSDTKPISVPYHLSVSLFCALTFSFSLNLSDLFVWLSVCLSLRLSVLSVSHACLSGCQSVGKGSGENVSYVVLSLDFVLDKMPRSSSFNLLPTLFNLEPTSCLPCAIPHAR